MSVSFFDGKITLTSNDNIEISTKLSVGDVTRVNNNILPTTTESFDLGSAQYNFRDQYTTGNTWINKRFILQENHEELSIRKRDITQIPNKLKDISTVTGNITAGRLIDSSNNINKQLDLMTVRDWELVANDNNLTLPNLFNDEDYTEDLDLFNKKRFIKNRGNLIDYTTYYLENMEPSSGTAVELFINGKINSSDFIFIDKCKSYCLDVYIIGRSINNKSVFIKSTIRIARDNTNNTPAINSDNIQIRDGIVPTITYSIATSSGKQYLKITTQSDLSNTDVIWFSYISSLQFKKSKIDSDSVKYDSVKSLDNTSGIVHRNCILKGISTNSAINLSLDSNNEYLSFESNTISYIKINVNARQPISNFNSYLDILTFKVLCNSSGELSINDISSTESHLDPIFNITPITSNDKLTIQVENTSNISTRWVADLDIITLLTNSTMDTSIHYVKNRLNLDTTEKFYILKSEGTNVSLTLDGQAASSNNVISIKENKTYLFHGEILSDNGSNNLGIAGKLYGIAMRNYNENATILYNTELTNYDYTCIPSIDSNNLTFVCTSTPSVKWYLKLTVVDISLDYD